MKSIYILVLGIIMPFLSQASEGDTVIIQLENNTKLIIYTESKSELKNVEKYDINKMVRDLNQSIASGDVSYIELEDATGKKYIKDTTILYQSGDKTAEINIGNISVEVDDLDENEDWDDKWDDIERKWDDDDDFKSYSYVDRPRKRTTNSFNFEIGINNWIDDFSNPPSSRNEPYTVKPWGSWFVGFNTTNKTNVVGPLFFEWGASLIWYNWKLQDPSYKIVKGDDMIEFVPPEAGSSLKPIKSKLVANYINITMVPVIDFAKGRRKVRSYERGDFRIKHSRRDGVRIGVGGYAGYRIYSRSKYVYDEGSGKIKDKNNDTYYLNNIRYGIRGQFGWKGLDIFFNYDLNEVFSTGKGPKLNAYSFGFII